MGHDWTIDIKVQPSGMIFAYLRVNPFGGSSAESMPAWLAQFRVRGHIAKAQNGYTIEAENIKISGEEFIHIKTNGNSRTKECLWPTSVCREDFITLAEIFAEGKVPA